MTITTVKALELKVGDVICEAGYPDLTVTHVRKSRRYKGFMEVQGLTNKSEDVIARNIKCNDVLVLDRSRLVAVYQLPSGQFIKMTYTDPQDSIHRDGKDIEFQLKGGEGVIAKRIK